MSTSESNKRITPVLDAIRERLARKMDELKKEQSKQSSPEKQ